MQVDSGRQIPVHLQAGNETPRQYTGKTMETDFAALMSEQSDTCASPSSPHPHTVFAVDGPSDRPCSLRHEEISQEYPIGHFSPDFAALVKNSRTSDQGLCDEQEEFVPLFGCGSAAFNVQGSL